MKKSIGIIIFLFLMYGLVSLYQHTGFLQEDDIDSFEQWDLANGLILGSRDIEFSGSDTCWVLVHGYTSTPDELRELAISLYTTFNDSVYVPRLHGHGERPSSLLQYSVHDWYEQVEQLMLEKDCRNIAGTSMGASIALRYAELHPVDKVVVVGTVMKAQPEFLNDLMFMHPVLHYLKKKEPGETVQRPDGKKEHLSYWVFPLKGAAELFEFNTKVVGDISQVKASVMFVHARQDNVASLPAAQELFDNMQTTKQFVVLEEGDHIVFRDYDRQEAIDHILVFRTQQG